MGKLRIEENAIVFQEPDGTSRMLLDFADKWSNKSHVPLQKAENRGCMTAADILSEIARQCSQFTEEEQREYREEFLLLTVLVQNQLIRTSRPVKVLELGCMDGLLSSLLGTLIGHYSQKSSLYCVSDRIHMKWVNRIALVQKPPRWSYQASEYHATNYEKQSFDLVVLNGMAAFENADAVIQEALRVLKPEGMLLSYVNNAPLLEYMLRLYFDTYECYELSPGRSVFQVRAADCAWEFQERSSLLRAEELLDQIAACLGDKDGLLAPYRDFLPELERYAKLAGREYAFDCKEAFLELKETVLNVAVSKEEAQRVFYIELLKEQIQKTRGILRSTGKGI